MSTKKKSTSHQQYNQIPYDLNIPVSLQKHINRPLNICIVSDFFLPRLGGVELHQYSLAQALQALGHRVIIITGSYGLSNQRQGIRYLTNGVKVYYCPQISFHNQVSLPTLVSSFVLLFRDICYRENIDIIHGHQTTSPLAHQCIMYGKTLNIPVIFTDHSMFGTATSSSIHVNKLGNFTFSSIDQVIAVSHTLRENIVVRTGIHPSRISVIPNALDYTKFCPDKSCQCEKQLFTTMLIDQKAKNDSIHDKQYQSNCISQQQQQQQQLQQPQQQLQQLQQQQQFLDYHTNLPALLPQNDPFCNPICSSCHLPRKPNHFIQPTFIFLSRLVYRKGTEFITSSIPTICRKYPQARFVIGGDGPHLIHIKKMLKNENLTQRVTLLGSVPHDRVRDVLQMGHIFVNTSLTETFCIAILEAICSGLRIVATRVGGVPEVLPQKLVELCDPNHIDVLHAMETALHKLLQSPDAPVNANKLPPTHENAKYLLSCYHPQLLHQLVAPFYSWYNVAKQTVRVYQQVLTKKYQLQPLYHGSNTQTQYIWEPLLSKPDINKKSKPISETDETHIYHNHRQFYIYQNMLHVIQTYWREHKFVSSILFIWTITFVSIIYSICHFFDNGLYASYDNDGDCDNKYFSVPYIHRDIKVDTQHNKDTVLKKPYGILLSNSHTTADEWK